MLARSSLRLASRAAFRPATFSTPVTRTFTTTLLRRDPEVVSENTVHVSGYNQGQQTTEDIKVDHSSGPVNPAGQDVEVKAIPLKKSVHASLTPTLSKFTLPGKVAIVTG
jgi:hypothetical protein